jgi:hypothetical protein
MTSQQHTEATRFEDARPVGARMPVQNADADACIDVIIADNDGRDINICRWSQVFDPSWVRRPRTIEWSERGSRYR